MKVPYKVFSASVLSALVAVPAIAAPAFAQDVTYGEAEFATLDAVSVDELGIIQAQGSSHPLYSTYFNEDGILVEVPITVEINGQIVDYESLSIQMAQSGNSTVNEFLNNGEELPVVDNEADDTNDIQTIEQEVTHFTNEARAAFGLQPLQLDTELSKVAEVKSHDMANLDYFSHDSPRYGSPFQMMELYGIDYTMAAENIARGYTSAESVAEGWMNSPGHAANILNPYLTHIGVGHAEDGNYWTQMFIRK